ncbi:tRNA (adenosine(37)-N6)-threonylcarbamoyltransferase complex dimerization subunit type 1 TsaB [uncultured Parabacteroides sp.]|uniref:tRNA (adenosine(37)-N6)-threonylcarbamoyltransferase complex dimerization subunit type 1 TsaB n=1 Tax=uncultured Parabacteroides sp. TaxID=512312 RepID=UPI00262830DE|nr:tRNA (adenosine(37)-N6)-threonylcarbamoyltransferase complex dimerization subunit type 1 TsaB [uncultured Parabacteroides sp.]
MSCILSIETSTSVCSVALSMDGEVLFEKASFDGPSHAALLGVFVEEALSVLKEKGGKLDAVAVSSGPGSYTGLRIGVSVAKGLCFGFGIPLIGIHTLDIMAATVIRQDKAATGCLYCAMLDARRMEVYAAIYDSSLKLVRETTADIVEADSYSPYLEKGKICFFGNGAAKCKSVITSPNAIFIEDIHPLAVNMVPLAEQAFAAGRFEDTAYFEPFYLKEFQATIAKNKVLGNQK